MAARLSVLVLLVTTSLAAEDWPQWRGPERTGVASLPAPSTWPDELERTWKVTVGAGYSSPVVAGSRVYQFSREADREVARAIDLSTGKVFWRQEYDAPYTLNPAAVSHGKGTKSTPLFHEGRLFTLGISGILSCFDAADGRVVWRSDFSDRFPETSPLYGSATSPMEAKGKLLVHLGGPADGAMMALNPENGKPIWAYEGDGPGYASPIVVTLLGIEQIVTQSRVQIIGVSLDAGKLLWKLPFTTPYEQNVVTPVAQGSRLIFAGLESPTFAIELVRGPSGLEPSEAWRSPKSFYMSTPVVSGDRLLGFSNERKGQVVALEATSGKPLWESEGRLGDNAALVLLGDALLILTSGGELLVLNANSSSFAPAKRYTVADSPTWAHPVPTSAGILIKDESNLALWKIGR